MRLWVSKDSGDLRRDYLIGFWSILLEQCREHPIPPPPSSRLPLSRYPKKKKRDCFVFVHPGSLPT